MGRKPTKIAASERVTLRVTPDVAKRAAALVHKIAPDAAAQGFTRVTPSTVLKRALLRGLDALEAEYAK
jgi:hypothetical protein